MTPAEKLIYYLSAYVDGVLTRQELITWLAQLPPKTLELIPPPGENTAKLSGIRRDAEELREQIADETVTVMSSSGYTYTKEDLQKDEPPADCDMCKRLRFLLTEAVHLVRVAQKVYANDELDERKRCAAEEALGWAFSSVDPRVYADMLEEAEKGP